MIDNGKVSVTLHLQVHIPIEDYERMTALLFQIGVGTEAFCRDAILRAIRPMEVQVDPPVDTISAR